MRRLLFSTFVPALLLLQSGCTPGPGLIENKEAYIAAVEQWQEARLERLKGKEGWLNLAGIYWLEEGSQRFGSDPANDLVFPEKAAPFLGTLTLHGEMVKLEVDPEVEMRYLGEPVTELELKPQQSHPSYVRHGDFAWYIMKRHTSLAVRLRDYANPAIDALDHIPSYSIDPDYVVQATLKPFEEPRTIEVATPFQDYTQEYTCPGTLHFTLKGKKLTLLPFESGEEYFLVISDESSALETYGGGRFMYATPDKDGHAVLDFNKAYNPPCAITPFAACPMPPHENHLPMKVEAGEKALHPR